MVVEYIVLQVLYPIGSVYSQASSESERKGRACGWRTRKGLPGAEHVDGRSSTGGATNRWWRQLS